MRPANFPTIKSATRRPNTSLMAEVTVGIKKHKILTRKIKVKKTSKIRPSLIKQVLCLTIPKVKIKVIINKDKVTVKKITKNRLNLTRKIRPYLTKQVLCLTMPKVMMVTMVTMVKVKTAMLSHTRINRIMSTTSTRSIIMKVSRI